MIGDLDVVYLVPKDLAFRCLKKRVYPGSVRLAVYKSCLDRYITKRTLWNTMPLLEDCGAVAVHCNYHMLSWLLDFADDGGYTHDVVFFHGQQLSGLRQEIYEASALPFILIYKGKFRGGRLLKNVIEVDGERPLEEIASKLVTSETNCGDTVLFIGDAIMMAPAAKRLCRHVVAFGDDPSVVEELGNEGVKSRRMRL